LRGRAVAALVALGLAAGLVALQGTPEAISGRAVRVATPPPPPAAPAAAASVSAPARPRPSRNLFEYVEATPPALEPAPLPLPEVVELDERPPPRLPVRLVGIVVQGGRLRAALAHAGDVLVLGPGDELSGYVVLAVDADEGVLLRTPEGGEILLSAPEAE